MSDKRIIELAKLLKERENIPKIGTVVGKVLETSGHGVSSVMILNQIIISGKQLVQSYMISKSEIKAGDLVIVVSSDDNNKFFIIDKVG